jgi:hypothetical protein
MRRKTLQANDPELIKRLLTESIVGHLGVLTPAGYPRVVPVNFVAEGPTIYFHGATSGEKHTAMKEHPQVTFCVYREYSVIPSFWLTEKAVGATQFYESVQLDGTISFIDNPDMRAAALDALMRKYQPEGNHAILAESTDHHARVISRTQVYRLDPTRIDCKVKLGQDLETDHRRDLITNLRNRGTPLDLATADAIEQIAE